MDIAMIFEIKIDLNEKRIDAIDGIYHKKL